MSVVFEPHKIGKLEVKNRFVHSATYECMAEETGKVTDKLIKRYSKLAQGEIGLITPRSPICPLKRPHHEASDWDPPR